MGFWCFGRAARTRCPHRHRSGGSQAQHQGVRPWWSGPGVAVRWGALPAFDPENHRECHLCSISRPLRVNALSLRNGAERWFGWGADTSIRLVDAVYASGALPLVFPPMILPDDDIVVDGGLKTMVGLFEAIHWGARRIIAIDVSEVINSDDTTWERQGLVGIHGRVVQILAEPQRAAIQAARGRVPTLHIRPDVGLWSSFTFNATRELIDAGYNAVVRALDAPESARFHAAAPIAPAIAGRRAESA